MASVVTPERYASGMTFDEYVSYVGTPENLQREATGGAARLDFSTFLREAFASSRLTDEQQAALKWLAAQPNGPARMLVISEEWSSDCRRDVPTFARIAAETGMELRIFRRDGQRFSDSQAPTLANIQYLFEQTRFITWMLNSAIIGASRPEQVHSNAKASGIELSQDVLDAIDEALGDVVIRGPARASFVQEGVKHR